jgi:hypothetical protein
VLYLGTTIKKIKNNEFKLKKRSENEIEGIESSLIRD